MSHARIAQIGGQIGPFLDAVQQRQVPVTVIATCKYVSMVSPADTAQHEGQVQMAILKAIADTVAARMASGQITFKDLGTGNTASIIPEVFARSGLAQACVSVDKLAMSFGIDGHAPAPLASAPPQPAAIRVAATPAVAVAPAVSVSKGKGGGSSGMVIGIVAFLLLAGAAVAFSLMHHHGNESPPPAAAKGHAGAKR